jgi:multiple sugar transport system permease protein
LAKTELISRAEKRKRRIWGTVTFIAITIFLIWTLTPLFIMVVSSFKDLREAFQIPRVGDWKGVVQFFQFSPTGRHYQELFSGDNDFTFYIVNSLVASLSASIIAVILGSLAAYGLARGRIPGEQHISFWIISCRMAPVVAVMVPLYSIFSALGLLEASRWRNLLCLILAYTTFSLPFAVWFLRSFFEDIPTELEEAARVDGCSDFKAFWDIILPLAKPGIVAAFILCLILSWNDFIFASIFGQQAAKTLPVATAELHSTVDIQWGKILASGTILCVPMLTLGLLIKKYLVQGLTMGAVRQ